MAIEIVDLPIENGDVSYVKLPVGKVINTSNIPIINHHVGKIIS
jgi:hypothetical protein